MKFILFENISFSLALLQTKITSNSSENGILGSPESIRNLRGQKPGAIHVSHTLWGSGGVNFPEKSVMQVDSYSRVGGCQFSVKKLSLEWPLDKNFHTSSPSENEIKMQSENRNYLFTLFMTCHTWT